jgi:hypothetical protein
LRKEISVSFNLPLADLQRKLKRKAKEASEAGQGSYLKNLEHLCINHGYKNRGQLERLVKAEERNFRSTDVGEILPSPINTDTVYRVKIGASIWALKLSWTGPKLQLQSRPLTNRPDDSDTSDLGLFQTITLGRSAISPSDSDWIVARYGMHISHSLDFMDIEEVNTLSKHFGIPYISDLNGNDQQQISEMSFLKSSAFLALREAMRAGTCQLPVLTKWSYGLCPLWGHLVAMSEHYLPYLDEIVDSYFRFVEENPDEARRLYRTLESRWAKLPQLEKSGDLDPNFAKSIIAWHAKSPRRSHRTL